jgi:hypothetical protein
VDDITAVGGIKDELGRYGVTDKWLRCVDCRWVYSEDMPLEFGSVCPKCSHQSVQTPFPRVEAWHLIEVVLEHAGRLDPDTAGREQEMLTSLERAGLGTLKAPALREMAANARLRVERGGYDALAGIGQELADKGAPQEQSLQLALELLMVAGQASPDVEAVIILAATALEALLDELWGETLTAFGLDGKVVNPLSSVVRRSSVPRQRVLLSELVPSGVEYPFEKDFVAKWDDVLERRNAVVHGRPFLVSTQCAREAVELTARSIRAFALANNRLMAAATGCGCDEEPTAPANP